MLFHTVNFWKCMCVRDFVAQLNVSHSRSEWDRVFFSNEPMLFDQKKGASQSRPSGMIIVAMTKTWSVHECCCRPWPGASRD